MIIQNGGIEAVEKWIEKEKKRSEQLKALITAENKETIVKFTYDYRCDRVYQMPADDEVK